MSDEPKVPIPELGDAVVQIGGDTLYQCMQCGLCTASCPWRLVEGEISHEFNVRKMQHMAQLGVEGYESDNILFACTTCGMCKSRCPRECNPTRVNHPVSLRKRSSRPACQVSISST